MRLLEATFYKKIVSQYEVVYNLNEKDHTNQVDVISFSFKNVIRTMVVLSDGDRLEIQLLHSASDYLEYEYFMLTGYEGLKADVMYRFNLIKIDKKPVDEMLDEEFMVYQKAGIDVSGDQEVVVFTSYKKGHSLWVINDEEYELISAALDVLEELIRSGEEKRSHNCYSWNEDNLVVSPFYETQEKPSKEVEISASLAKIKHRKHGKWLIGTYYLPFAPNADENGRLIQQHCCFLMDEETKEPIEVFDKVPDKSAGISFNEQLYQYMVDNKVRPKSVALYGDDDVDMFSNLFDHLDVEIELSNSYYLLNELWGQIYEDFQSVVQEDDEVSELNRTIH